MKRIALIAISVLAVIFCNAQYADSDEIILDQSVGVTYFPKGSVVTKCTYKPAGQITPERPIVMLVTVTKNLKFVSDRYASVGGKPYEIHVTPLQYNFFKQELSLKNLALILDEENNCIGYFEKK